MQRRAKLSIVSSPTVANTGANLSLSLIVQSKQVGNENGSERDPLLRLLGKRL